MEIARVSLGDTPKHAVDAVGVYPSLGADTRVSVCLSENNRRDCDAKTPLELGTEASQLVNARRWGVSLTLSVLGADGYPSLAMLGMPRGSRLVRCGQSPPTVASLNSLLILKLRRSAYVSAAFERGLRVEVRLRGSIKSTGG
jgi:hypothetical protein